MSELQADFELVQRSDIEATFEINVATKGDKGDTGDTGPQGPEGPQGPQGPRGPAGTIVSATASINNQTGIPTVEVTIGGTESERTLDFAFENLKGDQGEQGEQGETGEQGPAGRDATVNGVNTLTITATDGLSGSQSGTTYTISGNTLQQGIADINELIPEQASSSNQLADKSFVNSSIATNTANFIGTFESVTDLEAYSGTVTNNDYAFVVNQVVTDNGNDWATFNDLDAYDKSLLTNMDYAWVINGSNFDLYRFDIVEQDWELRVQNTPKAGISLNTAYNRYKAIVSGNTVNWEYEYTLNNSSFTANQWAAINSGATSTNIGQITTNQNAIGTLSSLSTSTKTDLVSALNEVNTTASGKVSDVTINGTSIVNGTTKVAAIPLAAQGGDYGLIKLRSSAYGLGVDSSGFTIVNRATTTDIDERTAYYKPITPLNLDYATIISLSDNKNALDAQDSEWTTARQFASRKWLGAMGSNIYGTSTTAASTVQKEVSIPSITELNAGQIIIVTPTVTSTVADSTLKLNNFPAYPMLYGGNAITTSTDSYVWIKDVPAWWLFDGSNWLFAGHGTDINTTYSAMTVANIIAGTETSGRLMRSDYLKNGIFGVVTAYSSGGTITPSDKYLYNSTSNISALTIAAPSSPDVRYMAQINMSSGSTATTLTYPSTFKVLEGCDDVQYIAGVRTFVPVANKRYQIFIENDGVNTVMFAKGV